MRSVRNADELAGNLSLTCGILQSRGPRVDIKITTVCLTGAQEVQRQPKPCAWHRSEATASAAVEEVWGLGGISRVGRPRVRAGEQAWGGGR